MSWKEAFCAILCGYAVLLVAGATAFLLNLFASTVSFEAGRWLLFCLNYALPFSTFFAVPVAIGLALGFQWENGLRTGDELKMECFWVAWVWSFPILLVAGLNWARDASLLGQLNWSDGFSSVLFAALVACFVALFWAPIIACTILWGIDLRHHRLVEEFCGRWSRGEK